jgi:hypothetical protein
MLHSGRPLCDTSFWCTEVVRLWLFEQVWCCSIGDVVLNFLYTHCCAPEHPLRAIVLRRCLFHWRSFSRASYILRVPLFHRRSFLWSPLCFRGASFFHQRSFFAEPLVFWGYLFFHLRSFLWSPLCFRGASFLSKVFFIQWVRGIRARLRSWLYYLA